MKVYNMDQKSEEWFKIKYGKVGGSTANNLMTDAKFRTLMPRLVSCNLEPFVMEEDSFKSGHVDRGNEFEPLARTYMCEYLGIELKEFGWLQSEIAILGISPDGVSEDFLVSSEFKCPSKEVHTKYIMDGDKIPAEYFWQNINYFATIPMLEDHYFVSYRPESSIEAHIIHLKRDTITKFGNSKKTVDEWAKLLKTKAELMNKEIGVVLGELTSREAF